MSLIEEYYDYVINPRSDISRERYILFGILYDMTDRRGLRQEWDEIDDDIKEEILNKWLEIIVQGLIL